MLQDTAREVKFERCLNEFETIDQNEKIYSLWLSVIEQAIIDLSTPPKNKKSRIIYKKAYIWFFGGDGEFEEVCALVNLDHRKILNSLEILKKVRL